MRRTRSELEDSYGMDFNPDVHRAFTATYRAFSISMFPGNERHDVERGNKILLPSSALDTLSRLHVSYPMMFKIRNQKLHRDTHCGVLEFSSEEGKCFLPYWMMRYLCLEEGDLLNVENTQVPVGSFAKFQPQSVDFLDITNPKAVLENALRNFACLSTNDVIAIEYNDKQYELCVLETKPSNAISIFECDLNVDFAAPVGYQEPERPKKLGVEEMDFQQPVVDEEPQGFKAFSGSGNRIDGKSKNLSAPTTGKAKMVRPRGVPDYEWTIGHLKFIRMHPKKEEETVEETFEAFKGNGQKLKPIKP